MWCPQPRIKLLRFHSNAPPSPGHAQILFSPQWQVFYTLHLFLVLQSNAPWTPPCVHWAHVYPRICERWIVCRMLSLARTSPAAWFITFAVLFFYLFPRIRCTLNQAFWFCAAQKGRPLKMCQCKRNDKKQLLKNDQKIIKENTTYILHTKVSNALVLNLYPEICNCSQPRLPSKPPIPCRTLPWQRFIVLYLTFNAFFLLNSMPPLFEELLL